MDDIGNIIYLILIILAGVSGLFKKKPQKEKPVVTKPQTTNPWEEIREQLEEIRQDFEQKEVFEVKKDPTYSYEVPNGSLETISTEKPFSYDDKYNDIKILNNNPVKNKKNYFSDDIKTDDIFHSDKLNTNDVIQFKDTEDVRKAIIYNEILNPKYI